MKLSTTGIIAILFLGSLTPALVQPAFSQQKEEKGQPAEHAPAASQSRPQTAPQSRPQAAPQRAQEAQPRQAQAAKPSPLQQPAHQEARQAPAPVARQAAQAKPQAPAARPQVQTRVQAQPRAQQVQPVRSAVQARTWQQNRGWAGNGSWQPHSSFQQNRDQNWASDHRDWAQRGGYGGSYISQSSFGLYFGSSHFFQIGVVPVMYMGYPRFAYGGYSFLMVDPYPGTWDADWYSSDQVYIDFDNGYYLHDRRYPGVRLAITVTL